MCQIANAEVACRRAAGGRVEANQGEAVCCCGHARPPAISLSYAAFVLIVACAPVVFYFYFINGLVCAPRAMAASAVFGIIPLAFLTMSMMRGQKLWGYVALTVLGLEIIITPMIMIHRLGWDKFAGERLLAFFTFEGMAAIQVVLALMLLKHVQHRCAGHGSPSGTEA